MNKRGQFTLFVVLGIVVLILIGLFIVFQDDLLGFAGISQELSYPSEVQEVVDHVQECVDASSIEAVTQIGYSGGYYVVPDRSFDSSSLGVVVPYFYDDGEDLTISSDTLEEELSSYVSALVDACVQVEQFSDLQIDLGDISTESLIEGDSVIVTVEYPFTVTAGESVYTITNPYEAEVVAGLGALRDVAESIVAYDVENPTAVDYTFLLGQGLTHITVAPVSQNTYFYVLQDAGVAGGIQNLTFIFAEYYSDLAQYGECYEDADCDEGLACLEGVCSAQEEEEA